MFLFPLERDGVEVEIQLYKLYVGENWFLLWGKAKYTPAFPENNKQLFLQREEFKIYVEKQTKKERKNPQQINIKFVLLRLISVLSDTSLQL